jgi:hypothetical protein
MFERALARAKACRAPAGVLSQRTMALRRSPQHHAPSLTVGSGGDQFLSPRGYRNSRRCVMRKSMLAIIAGAAAAMLLLAPDLASARGGGFGGGGR